MKVFPILVQYRQGSGSRQTRPQNNTYQLSQTETSSCTDENAVITFENGYVSITAEKQQVCTIYLDLVNE